MEDNLLVVLGERGLRQEVQALSDYNQIGERYGLSLTESQLSRLVERRFAALSETNRVEFGGGILKALIYAFCDSPYIDQSNYEETLATLQDLFYAFKNECRDRMTDDELIHAMKDTFDRKVQGSLEALGQTPVEDLLRAPEDGEEDFDDSWTE